MVTSVLRPSAPFLTFSSRLSFSTAGMKVSRHQELLASIGLKEALPFLCPRDVQKAVKKTVLPRQTYRNDTRIWTPEYVAYLKTLVHYPPKEVEDSNVFMIAVHVRRGDVTPCRDKNQGYDRYLPNLHYRNLIDQYYQPGARVVIFSQTTSHESFEEFSDKGYEVSLDDELDKIWRTIVTADVVILSRSSLSLIPAVVARGTVIYTPFWHSRKRAGRSPRSSGSGSTTADLVEAPRKISIG
jgi:hypothetical protein